VSLLSELVGREDHQYESREWMVDLPHKNY
jgi:hypothetical protein